MVVQLMFRCPDCERGYSGSGGDRNAAENAALARHHRDAPHCRFLPQPSDFKDASAVFEAPVMGDYLHRMGK